MFSEIWYCNSLWTHNLHDSHRGNGLEMVNGVLITQKAIAGVVLKWFMVYGLIIFKKVTEGMVLKWFMDS